MLIMQVGGSIYPSEELRSMLASHFSLRGASHDVYYILQLEGNCSCSVKIISALIKYGKLPPFVVG